MLNKLLYPFHEIMKYGAIVGLIIALVAPMFTMIAYT
jgi:hypothetical protein